MSTRIVVPLPKGITILPKNATTNKSHHTLVKNRRRPASCFFMAGSNFNFFMMY